MSKLILRRVIVSILGVVLVLGIGSGLQGFFGSRKSPVRQMSFRESAQTVKVEPIVYKSREIAIGNMARVISESAIDILSEVQGEIKRGSIPLKKGQTFSRGQILFKVDDREARLSLYAQKSNFMTAIAGILPELKLDYPDTYPRWQKYFDELSVEEKLPALPDINNSQEKVFFSTRDIVNQFYSIKSAEERLAKYIMRAPFSGSFIDVLQEVGGVVNGGTRVARVARSNQLELEMPIRVSDLNFVRKGLAVQIFKEGEEGSWPGKISRLSSTVDPTTQSANVYISFNPGRNQVLEGQYLRVEIPGNRLKDVMEIPRNAVFNKNQIYVVNDSNRLEVKSIQIEKFNEESLLFTGIPSGLRVVTDPMINAYENMPVKIAGEAMPGGKNGPRGGKDSVVKEGKEEQSSNASANNKVIPASNGGKENNKSDQQSAK